MSTKILAVLFFSIFISACGKDSQDKTTSKAPEVTEKKTQDQKSVENMTIKPESVLGKWVNNENQMGFDIKENGIISSINMATLDYNSWKLIENKLILNSTSKGVSNPGTTDEIYVIREITPLTMVVSPSNDPDLKWTYTKH